VIDLEYEPASLLDPPPPERVREFERRLGRYWERRLRLPAAYVEHITTFHGGVPGKKCFQTPSGKVRVLGRFFNFLEPADLEPPLTRSWRSWSSGPDVRLDYRVKEFLNNEFWCLRLSGTRLLPIAGLDTAGHDCRGMDEINLLCLDYSRPGPPSVAAWQFDGSWEDHPVKETVAASFARFLPMLYREANRITTEEIEWF
jgi:hypothetical protein